MPLVQTRGAASAQGFGEFAQSGPVNYIEEVFSTYLYTGNGATQTITNGIDLSTKGGLVWIKHRSGTGDHGLTDTVRGATKSLFSNQTYAELTGAADLTSFNTTGFSIGAGTQFSINNNNSTYASWTFREQAKFFDIVTYTGNNAASRQIAHSLGSTPGCVIVKATNNVLDWYVSHRSLATANAYLNLNTTAASATGQNWGNSGGTRPTSTDFTVGDNTNVSGYTYVAYLFAHDAGGFGLTGLDNVISCGTFITDGSSNATVNLGYEPQWILQKPTSGGGGAWIMFDNMRGFGADNGNFLFANNATAEGGPSTSRKVTSTGFTVSNLNPLETYIYIAIRRGPMKVPTTGTSVFYPTLYAGNGAATQTITGASFAPDLSLLFDRNRDGLSYTPWTDRLRGGKTFLESNNTNGETTNSANGVQTLNMNGVTIAAGNSWNSSTFVTDGLTYLFGRAPSFFDEVCYTGDNAFNRAITHNLTVVPELVITKVRSTTSAWAVYTSATGLGFPMSLNTTNAAAANPYVWGTTSPTSTNFYIGDDTRTNGGGFTYVSYFFATCAGVSKVGSYTGTGTTQTINCGFTGGARFVLIKRTDSTGDWYVWDSARGIVAGNDPYLLLNSTAAEVTNTDYVDTANSGFEISSTAPAAINANGGTFIFLAIA